MRCLLDQVHDLIRGQGGQFVTVLVFEPLVDLIAVRRHRLDENAVLAGFNDELCVWFEAKLFANDFGNGDLS